MFVYVDDTHPAIRYGRGWTASNRSEIFEGYGSPLYGTLHGANDTAILSFSFSGTYVAVFLLSQSRFSSYNCTIDGIASVAAAVLPNISSSNWANPKPGDMASCHGTVNNDGRSHELQVTVSGTQSNPIFFDYLLYTPSETVTSADQGFVRGDSAVVLGPTDPDTLGLLPGSTLEFIFAGYSATIRGAFDLKTFSQPPSPVSYTIDGGIPVILSISNPATNTTPLLNNQVLIQTPRYPFGRHILHVTFLGTNETVPFIPTDFIVQNRTSRLDLATSILSAAASPPSHWTSSSWASSSWPSHSSSQSSTPASSRSGSPVAILGSALGTVTLIVVLLLAIVLVRRKSRVPGEYIPHHLLQETTILPSSHATPPSQRTPRKAASRPTSGRNPPNRSTSPVGGNVSSPDSGSRVQERKPEDETRREDIDVLPRYETINDGIT